jgi:hypothetical protein
MLHKKVRVFWPVDESWYTGVVQEYDPETGEHLLKYQDGDTEWVKIGENNTNSSSSGRTGSPIGSAGGGGGDVMDHHHPGDAMDNAMKGQPDGGDRDTGEPRQWLPTGGGDGTYPAHTYFQGPYGAQGPAPPGAVPAYGGMPPYGLMYAPYGGGHMYPAPGGGYGPPSGAMGKSDDGGMMIGGDFYGRRKTGPKAWSKHEDELLLSIVQS